MFSSRTNRVLAISLVAAFTLMAVSPLFVTAQAVPGTANSGPYIDKLTFRVITQDDAQVLALQNNEIDLIEQQLDPTYLPALAAADNIEVVNIPRNGYGYLCINNARYPFNITAFRRALAFAIDKEKISDQVWDGLSVPQDSCVPQVNPFSIEGLLPYTYYEANVPLGNQLLDEAGFHDIDDDTFREAPNGDEIQSGQSTHGITVECHALSPIAMQSGEIAAEALRALHFDAVSKVTDFYEYLARLNNHLDFDMVFLGVGFTTMDVDWLAYDFWSEYADEPNWNRAMFRNATYDSWRDQLLHSTDYDDVYEAAIEMQRIWVYQCPEIVLYENVVLSAYRTDKFEGFINDVSAGVSCWWTNYKVHLKQSLGGPFGGTLRWSNSLDIDTFNFMSATSAYSANVLNQLYDSLINRDAQGADVLWLAESYVAETNADNPDVPEGHTRFTFDMIQNATWTDGQPLTAYDVAFTMNFYREAPANQYGSDLTDLQAAYATSTYQVVVEMGTESYWHLHTIGYKPIIPKHVFELIGAANWATWNPQPPNQEMVTSGPFNVSDYLAGEYCEETYNPNYFFGPDRSGVTTTTTTATPANFTLAVVAGAVGAAVVILVGGYILLRQK